MNINTDTNINNWQDLIDSLSNQISFSVEKHSKTLNAFSKLLVRVNRFINTTLKKNGSDNLKIVSKIYQDTFDNFKMIFQQLLLEDDILDVFVDVPSLNSNDSIFFSMIGLGKWIKFHSGNISRIFFIDEEKNMISDKSIADFIVKITKIRTEYLYFSKNPVIYYKFASLPSNDVMDYFQKNNITVLSFSQKTDSIACPINDQKILLDQSILMSLCSHLSQHPNTESFYEYETDNHFCNRNYDNEQMLTNKEKINKFIQDKEIIMCHTAFQQSKAKIKYAGGPTEIKQFEELEKQIIVVPDQVNTRFHYLTKDEMIIASVAEKECAVILTGNQRFCSKLDLHYQEIMYQLFQSVQLFERKNM